MTPEIARLLLKIEEQLNWGSANEWQTRDFEKLQELIFDRTGVSLSTSTLRRIWGHVNYDHAPSKATLDALAVFAGFEGWRQFIMVTVPAPSKKLPSKKTTIYLLLVLVAIIACLSIFRISQKPVVTPAALFALSAKRITNKIPNSVVFTYDASKTPSDSVFIQQSWDLRTRTAVPKTQHIFTSIYYEPGFFHAKLYAGAELVKEDTVMIPTNGWTGYIRQFPVPVYLQPSEFMTGNKLELPEPAYIKKGLSNQSPLPFTIYSNVGNITRVPVDDFHFHADVRNNYKIGTGICQSSYIGLLTNDEPIIIPLSDLGCISDLKLIVGSNVISGKMADLSGFGADMFSWVSVDCHSSAIGIEFHINGKKAYTAPLPKTKSKILGMIFMYRGSGAVRNIDLFSGNKLVYSAFTTNTN